MIDPAFLDESGFAPTLPTGDTWARKGVRALVRDEPPQGRRLNVPGALAPLGDDPRLVWTTAPGKLDAAVLLDFLWRDVAGLATAADEVPPGYRRARPLVVVLDNYSVHRSKAVKATEPALARDRRAALLPAAVQQRAEPDRAAVAPGQGPRPAGPQLPDPGGLADGRRDRPQNTCRRPHGCDERLS